MRDRQGDRAIEVGRQVRVVAFASLTSTEINFALVDQVIKDILDPKRDEKGVSINLIKKAAAETTINAVKKNYSYDSIAKRFLNLVK